MSNTLLGFVLLALMCTLGAIGGGLTHWWQVRRDSARANMPLVTIVPDDYRPRVAFVPHMPEWLAPLVVDVAEKDPRGTFGCAGSASPRIGDTDARERFAILPPAVQASDF